MLWWMGRSMGMKSRASEPIAASTVTSRLVIRVQARIEDQNFS